MAEPEPPPDDGEPEGYVVVTPELIDLIEQQSGDAGEDSGGICPLVLTTHLSPGRRSRR